MTKEELQNKILEEGDFFEWTNSFKCFIQRQNLGFWCGYITIPTPIYDLIDEIGIYPHGGITYNSQEGNLTTIGFDCAHYLDLIPDAFFNDLTTHFSNSIYRDKNYVIDEVNKISECITSFISNKRSLKIDEILLSL